MAAGEAGKEAVARGSALRMMPVANTHGPLLSHGPGKVSGFGPRASSQTHVECLEGTVKWDNAQLTLRLGTH